MEVVSINGGHKVKVEVRRSAPIHSLPAAEAMAIRDGPGVGIMANEPTQLSLVRPNPNPNPKQTPPPPMMMMTTTTTIVDGTPRERLNRPGCRNVNTKLPDTSPWLQQEMLQSLPKS
jgi:hypothetical protein